MTTTEGSDETGSRQAATTGGLVDWLRVGGIVERLAEVDHPQVADLGCGTGRPTIVLGEQFPTATVVGLDPDLTAVEEARANVARARRAAQIAIRRCRAADLAGGPYDLVTILHLLGAATDPVGILVAARTNLAPGGEVLVADSVEVARYADAAGFDEVEELAVTPGFFRVYRLR